MPHGGSVYAYDEQLFAGITRDVENIHSNKITEGDQND
jgi:hypothetical protein